MSNPSRGSVKIWGYLVFFMASAVGCGSDSKPMQPSAPAGPVAIRVTVRVNSLDASGASAADFPVSAGGESAAGSPDGVVFVVNSHRSFQVTVGQDKAEGHTEVLSGFCGGDSGGPTAPGEERVCAITETEQPLKCDPDLWRKTYAPWRFRKYSDCEIGAGTVEEVWQSDDGDLDLTVRPNGALALAPGQQLLMVEAPCQFPTTWQMAKDACGNVFQNTVHIAAGVRIRFAGPRVADGNHTPANPQTENHGAVIRVLSRKNVSAQAQSFMALPVHREGYLGGGRYEPEEEPRER